MSAVNILYVFRLVSLSIIIILQSVIPIYIDEPFLGQTTDSGEKDEGYLLEKDSDDGKGAKESAKSVTNESEIKILNGWF